MNNGYLEVLCYGHERANPNNGFVYVHVLEAEKMLGRKLKAHEHVHHIDEDRTNNNHSNLMVVFDRSDHAGIHEGRLPIKRLDGSFTTVKKRYKKTWYERKTKISWPGKNELITRLSKSNFTKLSQELGVSDTAIRKRLKSLGVDPKKVFTQFS
jgi:hypothetical protein